MTLVDAELQCYSRRDQLEEPTVYRLLVAVKMSCFSCKSVGLKAGIRPKHGRVSPIGAQKIFGLRVCTDRPVCREAGTF